VLKVAGPGHKHKSIEEKGENIQFIHIRYKSNTVQHKKLQKREQFRISI
jgi:hypothetical protein